MYLPFVIGIRSCIDYKIWEDVYGDFLQMEEKILKILTELTALKSRTGTSEENSASDYIYEYITKLILPVLIVIAVILYIINSINVKKWFNKNNIKISKKDILMQ